MTRFVLFLSLALFLLVYGCGEKGDTQRISSEKIEDPRPGSSPVEVMENLALAYGRRDTELYKNQLDRRFELRLPFGQEEWGADERSGYEKEIENTGGILEMSDWVRYAASCDEPLPSKADGYPASEGFLTLMIRDIDVAFSIAGTEDTFTVTDDSVLFVFSPDSTTQPLTWRVICQQLFEAGCPVEPVDETQETD